MSIIALPPRQNWDSPEARKLFRAHDDEDTQQSIRSQIKELMKANETESSYVEVIQDGEFSYRFFYQQISDSRRHLEDDKNITFTLQKSGLEFCGENNKFSLTCFYNYEIAPALNQQETYQFAEDLSQRLHLNLKVYQSPLSPARMEAIHGKLWSNNDLDSLNLYDKIRKVEPIGCYNGSHGQENMSKIGMQSYVENSNGGVPVDLAH